MPQKEKPRKLRCKNCNLVYKGYFCPRCGQNASVKRFDFRYFLRESFVSSLDIENGFFPTIKALTITPGPIIKAYLAGQRLKLTIPMRYLIVMGAIAAIITIRYKVFAGEDSHAPFAFLNFMEKEFWEYATEFVTIHNIVAVPVFAYFSFLFFKKAGFNFSENLILNMYVTAHQLFILLLFFPVIELFLEQKTWILYAYTIITLIYNFWVFISFFNWWNLRGVLSTIAAMVCAYFVQLFLNYGLFKILKVFDLIPHLKNIDLPG